jgi:predicted ATP-binding protein involved in virulence
MGTTDLSDVQTSDTIISLFDDNAMLINAEEWLLQADYAAKSLEGVEQERAEKRRDRIKELLIRLLPDVSDIRFAPTNAYPIRTTVQAHTPYGWVPIQNMSLGYRTLMTWMVDFASRLFERYPDSPDPLAEPAIALVDEIDLHVHPRWQRTLMQFLSETFPNTQFIVSAHSPLVVQAATDANIVLLRREGDHVVIDNDIKAIRGWRVDQVLTSDLFGLESARPPQNDAALKERTRLLSKTRLTAKDKVRLQELEAEIGSLPTGETPQDLEAMDIIRRAAELLKKQE